MAVARVTELTASSKESFEAAVKEGIARAAQTLRNIKGARVEEQKVKVEDGRVTEYRVTMKVTFVIDD
ncbi:MAG: dodecin domain-containing protein [Myxococcales bacterium]|nr:dodecin domain-containing protein [Myxococcales bacterium]MCB9731713.1 dodecin domain-containing protein [Deltaproteobacteria bacterium]